MKIQRSAIFALTAALAFLAMPGTGAASTSSSALATVKRAVMAFNAGDMKAWVATCGSSTHIIDDFPPFEWQGASACATWWNALMAFMKNNDISNSTVALGPVWQNVVVGNRAYVVVSATLHSNAHGKPSKEIGSILTVALRNTANGWVMAAWSWSQHP
jgi:ketosteroid isomerase-like protein